MYIQIIADAMSGAVVVIESHLPECFPRKIIKVDPKAALPEFCGNKIQISF